MRSLFFLPVFLLMLYGCTKKVGANPTLAYGDAALYDSCASQAHLYYKNDPNKLLPGTAGPHGTFKLRFNAIAYKALTDSGRLSVGGTMPEGSLIIKDVYSGGALTLYAFMYKHSGSWLWAEINKDRSVRYSVTKDPSVCTGCHSQAGNRDQVVSFKAY